MEHLTATSDRLLEARVLLRELRERGATVSLSSSGTIEVEGHGAEALIPRIRALKPALLVCLSDRSTWPCSRCGNFAFPQRDAICYWCRSRPVVTA